eukprot:TRINITY_DN2293_c0_g1_i1.p1 TRINITY_DN2293_c0_g1~~TRINITY_DN2293_c0_g1_i1.p1  ORF type:complete len:842 (+),score=222.09 TRINITY_DN2293_c0_g1_i1:110-2635(+)
MDEKLYRYSKLNLNLDEYGEVKAQQRITRRDRHISLFWWEKFAVISYFFQIHALIWLAALHWRFDNTWMRVSRYTLLFNLDFATFGWHTGSPYDMTAQSIFISLLPSIVLVSFYLINKYAYTDQWEPSLYEERHWISHLVFERVSHLIFDFLYIPTALVCVRVARCWSCSCDSTYAADPAGACCQSSASQVTLTLFTVIFNWPFLLIYPFYLFRITVPLVVFGSKAAHEQYIKSREVEYVMGINILYEVTHFYLIASYTRRFALSRAGRCILKCLMVLMFAFIQTRTALATGLLCVLFVGPAAYTMIYRQFRCLSTNILRGILDIGPSITLVVGFFVATGAKSSFFEGNGLFSLLMTINIGVMCLALALIIYLLFIRPNHAVWPITMTHVHEISLANPDLLTSVNIAKRLLEDARIAPKDFFPRHLVKEAINIIRTTIAQLREQQSINKQEKDEAFRKEQMWRVLQLPKPRTKEVEREALMQRGRQAAILLERMLMDLVEDLALLYQQLQLHARDRNKDEQERAHNERLQESLSGFGESLERRHFDRLLMKREKCQLIDRLMVLGGLLGDDFLHGTREEWKPPSAAEPRGSISGRVGGASSEAMSTTVPSSVSFSRSMSVNVMGIQSPPPLMSLSVSTPFSNSSSSGVFVSASGSALSSSAVSSSSVGLMSPSSPSTGPLTAEFMAPPTLSLAIPTTPGSHASTTMASSPFLPSTFASPDTISRQPPLTMSLRLSISDSEQQQQQQSSGSTLSSPLSLSSASSTSSTAFSSTLPPISPQRSLAFSSPLATSSSSLFSSPLPSSPSNLLARRRERRRSGGGAIAETETTPLVVGSIKERDDE